MHISVTHSHTYTHTHTHIYMYMHMSVTTLTHVTQGTTSSYSIDVACPPIGRHVVHMLVYEDGDEFTGTEARASFEIAQHVPTLPRKSLFGGLQTSICV